MEVSLLWAAGLVPLIIGKPKRATLIAQDEPAIDVLTGALVEAAKHDHPHDELRDHRCSCVLPQWIWSK